MVASFSVVLVDRFRNAPRNNSLSFFEFNGDAFVIISKEFYRFYTICLAIVHKNF